MSKEKTTITKDNLMAAFLSLYVKKSIERITIKEITDTAGYHRGTFYEYYKDVYDVLEQVEDIALTNVESALKKTFGEKRSFSPGFFLHEVTSIFDKNFEIVMALFSGGSPDFYRRLKDRIKEIFFRYLPATEGEKRIELGYVIEYQISAVIAVVSYGINQEEPFDPEKMIRILSEISRKGVFKKMEECCS